MKADAARSACPAMKPKLPGRLAKIVEEEDHDDEISPGTMPCRGLRQAASVRAHAMNEGDHHPNHDDILPAF